MDPARRAQLLLGKVRALSIESLGASDPKAVPYFAGSAAFDASSGMLIVLVEAAVADRDPLDIDPLGPRPPRGWLGGAIVAARRAGATRLELLGDESLLTGDDARRAGFSAIPAKCWSVQGRTLVSLQAVSASAPARLADLPTDERAYEAVIRRSGADPVVENGVLRAEVLGLEIARVQRNPADDAAELSVGVGRHDRLAQSMMNAGVAADTALADAAQAVQIHRKLGAPAHPANSLARSRWLRSICSADPSAVEAASGIRFTDSLDAVSGLMPTDLKALSVACSATTVDHKRLTVGFSVGIDLDAPIDLVDVDRVSRSESHGDHGTENPLLVVLSADAIPALATVCETLTPRVRVIPITSPFVQAE